MSLLLACVTVFGLAAAVGPVASIVPKGKKP
jgi:hypothetical protein